MTVDATTKLRVLLVDDHEIVREGLRAVLGRAGVEVVAEALFGSASHIRQGRYVPQHCMRGAE
jgi:DNA-binding NarL/FixJ family response regulator